MTDALKVQVGGDHYKRFPIQPMLFNVANNMPWAEGEVIKYVARWRFKGKVQDLKKAHHILGFLIEFHEGRMNQDALLEALREVMEEPEHLDFPSVEGEPQPVGFPCTCDLCGEGATWHIGGVHLCATHESLRKTNRASFVQLLTKAPQKRHP